MGIFSKNEPILRKLTDRRKDGWKDGWTDSILQDPSGQGQGFNNWSPLPNMESKSNLSQSWRFKQWATYWDKGHSLALYTLRHTMSNIPLFTSCLNYLDNLQSLVLNVITSTHFFPLLCLPLESFPKNPKFTIFQNFPFG